MSVTFEPEHTRAGGDAMLAYVAAVRFQQQIAREVIQGTLKKTEEFQRTAQATHYERNFSRVNLLV